MRLYVSCLVLILAWASADIARRGYKITGASIFVACVGFFVMQWLSDWRYPGSLGSENPQAPVTAINGLPLPSDLLGLIGQGRWECPADLSGVRRFIPGELIGFNLYSLRYMPIENAGWVAARDSWWFGMPDPDRLPGDIDPRLSLLIGDLGHGSDQPIALDYRVSMNEPRVLAADWGEQDGKVKYRWVEIATDVKTFAEQVGF